MRYGNCLGSLALVGVVATGCGPTPAEQQSMDQGKCYGYGFAPGTDAFAHCMMGVGQQREAQEAADARMRSAQWAADERARAAQRAAQDAADRDAWDKQTGQGQYANGAQTTNRGMPDTSGMKCTSSSTTTGTDDNSVTKSTTNCHN